MSAYHAASPLKSTMRLLTIRTSSPRIKFYDDLLKQNSMVHLGWDVYRWAVRQMQIQPYTVKDELRVFLGDYSQFKEIEDYLPTQRARSIDAGNLELKAHQNATLFSLHEMRENGETIGLLYHATGTGKTVTAVMDAKTCVGQTLFLAHTHELVDQAAETFRRLWPVVTVGRYMDAIKQQNAYVVCGSIQSVALNLDKFKDSDFDYLIIDEVHHASADTYQVVFCASVKHAEEIAALFIGEGIAACAMSGSMKASERQEHLAKFAAGEIKVLCACDLLNESWDCLMVFDFVDNASQYNMPQSLHWLFQLKDYHAGGLVLAPQGQKTAEEGLYAKGEKPDALIDWPVDAPIMNWWTFSTGKRKPPA